MSMSQMKAKVKDQGFVEIRYTIKGHHYFIRYSCPYMAFCQGIDMMDAKLRPRITN